MLTSSSDHLSINAIAQNAAQGKWRTEAMRSHRTPRLIYIGKGQGRITLAGLTSGYTANNLIFVPPGTMYGYTLGPTVYGQMITIPHAMAADWPDMPVHLRLWDVIAQKELVQILDAIEREFTSDQVGAARAALHQLGLLAIFFERQRAVRSFAPKDDRSESTAARLVAAFTDLVEKDFQHGHTIASYAARLGVTPTHLTRCCKQTAGVSAHKLLQDRILFDARIQLRDSTRPIADIAKGLGFGSAAYFSRTFQNWTGETPSGFRKKGLLTDAKD